VAIDESASIACARVMRGISSTEKVVMPRSTAGKERGGFVEWTQEADHDGAFFESCKIVC
jgi:hypothetical protein